MRSILFFLVFFIAQHLFAGNIPKDYAKNSHVKYSCEIISGSYFIKYTFKDNFEKLRTFTIKMPVKNTISEISKFGVPKWMYKPYPDNKRTLKKRNKIIKKGLFKTVGNILRPDYYAVAVYYSTYTQSISGQLIQLLTKEKADTRKNRIEIAMKFVQDIPYGVPEISDTTWETDGVFSPLELLIRMYGDCDSKAILFASILRQMINPEDIIFLFTSDKHALTAIKGNPEKGQVYIAYLGYNYIISDTSGPERLAFGDDGNKSFKATAYKVESALLK